MQWKGNGISAPRLPTYLNHVQHQLGNFGVLPRLYTRGGIITGTHEITCLPYELFKSTETSSHGQVTHSLEMYLSIVGSVNTGLLSLSKIYIRRAREGGHIAHTLGTKKPPKSRPHPPANSPTDLPNDTSHREDVHLCKCASSCWG